MTIGIYGYDLTKGDNPDFVRLRQVREHINQSLNIPLSEIELSMGMSSDYENAVSTLVIVASNQPTLIWFYRFL